jgi:hypothetical protein
LHGLVSLSVMLLLRGTRTRGAVPRRRVAGILRRLRSLAIADAQKINMIFVSARLHPIAADASAAESCARN